MLRKILGTNTDNQTAKVREEEYRGLIRREAIIGGTLFGDVPSGHRREFFNLDKHTWVWHEEWIRNDGIRQIRTTRYDVRPSGIVKSSGQGYQALTSDETRNFRDAVRLYYQRVQQQLYSKPA